MGVASGRRLSWLIAAILLVGAACSEPPETTPVTGELPDELGVVMEADLPCPGSLVDPPADFEVVLDVVALPSNAKVLNALQTSRRVTADGNEFYFAKTGLWWRGDADFEILVPDEFRSAMAIGWGGPAEMALSVYGDCGLSEEWMVMAGGYWVSEPMCVAVIVRAGDVEERVEIGIGEPCAGQGPPTGPSDD